MTNATCRCNPPMEAMPGEEWTCSDCKQLYWADEAREWQAIIAPEPLETAGNPPETVGRGRLVGGNEDSMPDPADTAACGHSINACMCDACLCVSCQRELRR